MKVYKNILVISLVIISSFCLTLVESKAYGLVEYLGESEKFIFSPGSDSSKKELFVEHESMMPGDEIDDVIEIRNKSLEKVNIQVYMRALELDESQKDFLSKLTMRIKHGDENTLHSSRADEIHSLRDWMFLGDVKSGDSMITTLELDIPKDLDNNYSLSEGRLKWQFKVVEVPVKEEVTKLSSNEANQNALLGKGFIKTGDSSLIILVVLALASSLLMWLVIGYKGKKEKKNEKVK